ncbi:MAG: DUF711 family protein [Flavonifractor sp.]|jgi:hypothetical protein|nr:DUF711 family protein [Flavonifractor sp.]
MIGIRSITYHMPKQITMEQLEQSARLSRMWDRSFPLIRTQRLCLCPVSEPADMDGLKPLSLLCDMSSIRWFNVPIAPQNSKNPSELFGFAHNVLADYGRAFVNVLGVVAGEIRPGIFDRCAELIRKTSALSANGQDNFRLGISVNVKPNGPFFPFTYSSGEMGFSIALELTQEINEICAKTQGDDLGALRSAIIAQLIPQIEAINMQAVELSVREGLTFHGFDFSLAPIIDENGSIITILNRLGVYNFGHTGTMFATSFLTNILKHLACRFKSVGFSGVMYSLLEDLELCSINNQRGVTLEQMISLSTMCGCGVDMVPVYGKIKQEELRSILLDVAGISCRLHKPLGVRILPIPQYGRSKAGFTTFHNDSDFISNTRVVGLNLNLISELGESFTYLNTSMG